MSSFIEPLELLEPPDPHRRIAFGLLSILCLHTLKENFLARFILLFNRISDRTNFIANTDGSAPTMSGGLNQKYVTYLYKTYS